MHSHIYSPNHVLSPGLLAVAFLAAVTLIVALHFTMYAGASSSGTPVSGSQATALMWPAGPLPNADPTPMRHGLQH